MKFCEKTKSLSKLSYNSEKKAIENFASTLNLSNTTILVKQKTETENTIICRLNHKGFPFFYIYMDKSAYVGTCYTFIDKYTISIIKCRTLCRKEKDYKTSDKMRNELIKDGFRIIDNINSDELFWINIDETTYDCKKFKTCM